MNILSLIQIDKRDFIILETSVMLNYEIHQMSFIVFFDSLSIEKKIFLHSCRDTEQSKSLILLKHLMTFEFLYLQEYLR